MLARLAAGRQVGHKAERSSDQVSTGVMTKAEAEEIISIEFNPIRCGFDGSPDVWVEDVLNLGVSPRTAIQMVTYHILLLLSNALKAYQYQSLPTFLYFQCPQQQDLKEGNLGDGHLLHVKKKAQPPH